MSDTNLNTDPAVAQYQSIILKQITDQFERASKSILGLDEIKVCAHYNIACCVSHHRQTLIQESEQRVLDSIRAERKEAIKREQAMEVVRKKEMKDLEDRYVSAYLMGR